MTVNLKSSGIPASYDSTGALTLKFSESWSSSLTGAPNAEAKKFKKSLVQRGSPNIMIRLTQGRGTS
ncbi:hypothetical protein AGABI2DRAFT_190903 [Agaricus bisporus var. bisporus H97]|uniref:hypothetical protein n=1 Tax=Agaricus bisporus var. bisporus (strain H97 / ATCC MYA-4626 / FGSC 10389) TaxID=936046 RepID=UPI00029F678D|nr:hypothetical protein AGABI2DRAFT_190903 [Agaricus bisporus var. bisporus H97]EKV50633.1 hypothetical protein AGABI2DRAFT_190903 [Agaricus bisporus var. bisporus H97]